MRVILAFGLFLSCALAGVLDYSGYKESLYGILKENNLLGDKIWLKVDDDVRFGATKDGEDLKCEFPYKEFKKAFAFDPAKINHDDFVNFVSILKQMEVDKISTYKERRDDHGTYFDRELSYNGIKVGRCQLNQTQTLIQLDP